MNKSESDSAVAELDIQIDMPAFVVEREPNVSWHLTDRTNESIYVLGYAKSGSALYRFGGRNYSVGKGDIVFIRMGETYSAKSSPDNPWAFYSAGFSMTAADSATVNMLQTLPNIFRCSDSSRMNENFSELNRIWSTRQKGYKIKCRSLLLDIMYILLGDEDRRSMQSAHYEKLNEIVDMMRRNYDRSYSLDELCGFTGLSSSHFRMLFKQLTGLSTVQFQNRLKIDKAKDLILSHTCNVTEAAQAVGYSDVYYFSRMFRKLTGTNPSEYL